RRPLALHDALPSEARVAVGEVDQGGVDAVGAGAGDQAEEEVGHGADSTGAGALRPRSSFPAAARRGYACHFDRREKRSGTAEGWSILRQTREADFSPGSSPGSK